MENIYKCYYIDVNNERVYLRNKGGTNYYCSINGIKRKIAEVKHYPWHKDTKFIIEQYSIKKETEFGVQ